MAALALDGKVIEINGLQAEINTVLVPVRWQDFDAGEIERLLTPFYQTNAVDMIVTISQGRSEFDLERFPARRRSSLALDNLRGFSGGTAENPLPVTLNGKLLKGEEFVEFSLPAAAMMRAKGKYKINDNDKVTTLQKGQVSGLTLTDLQKMTAVAGSGGGYMSNEISYRSIRLRNELHSSIPTGHIHTPIVAAGDQAAMAQVVEQIENMLIMALPTLENNVSVN